MIFLSKIAGVRVVGAEVIESEINLRLEHTKHFSIRRKLARKTKLGIRSLWPCSNGM